jgi:hypothetical protein
MGVHLKLLPGVRLRLTRRGRRWRIGPRLARCHFGAGGRDVSTGPGRSPGTAGSAGGHDED